MTAEAGSEAESLAASASLWAWDRGAVARRFGMPTEQIGSVNDPRTQETAGVRWNEKWVYRDPEHAGFDRLVLWFRYDLRGVFRLGPDGTLVPEALPERP